MKVQCKLCKGVVESVKDKMVGCECGEILLHEPTKQIVCKTALDNYSVLPIEIESRTGDVARTEAERVKQWAQERIDADTQPREGPDRETAMQCLHEYIHCLKELPQQASIAPITHYDLCSVLELIATILSLDGCSPAIIEGAGSPAKGPGTAAACNLSS